MAITKAGLAVLKDVVGVYGTVTQMKASWLTEGTVYVEDGTYLGLSSGGSHFSLSTQSPPGTYTDSFATILPDGGDGSIAWIRLNEGVPAPINLPSLVDKLKSNVGVKGLYVRPLTGGVAVGVSNLRGYVTEYRFEWNPDNLLLMAGGYIAPEDTTTRRVRAVLNGTFVTANPPSSYTVTVGDSVSMAFTGTSFKFKRLCESRGGYWRISVLNANNAVVKTVEASCYSATTTTIETEVVSGLPYGPYTIQAKFMGDDPSFAPSSSPSRGYVYYDLADATVTAFKLDKINQITLAAAIDALSSRSIPDFAISAKPDGAAYNAEWVPSHGPVGASDSIAIKVLADGEQITGTPGLDPPISFREISKFEIQQKFNALNPNGADGAMWEHYITHSIDLSGELTITQRMTVLQDTYVSVGYFSMLPVENGLLNLDRFILNDRFVKTPVPTDDSSDTFNMGATSAAYLGEFSSGIYYGVAIDIASLAESASLGRDGFEVGIPGLITYRVDSVSKVYWKFLEGVTIQTGDVFTNQVRICTASGIPNPNNLVSTVG